MRKLPWGIAGVLGVVAVLVLLTQLKLRREYRATLPLEGVVTDAVTGKPVDKMIVAGVWYFQRPNLVDSTGQLSVHHAVTAEDGRYAIPKNRINAILASFIYFEVRLMHPLYETKTIKILSYSSPEYLAGDAQGDKLTLNIPIRSLEDRYSKPEDVYDLASLLSTKRAEWYLFLKRKYGVRYDMEEVHARWEKLVNRFREDQDKNGHLILHRDYRALLKEMKQLEGRY